jgi:hypothetical protein
LAEALHLSALLLRVDGVGDPKDVQRMVTQAWRAGKLSR